MISAETLTYSSVAPLETKLTSTVVEGAGDPYVEEALLEVSTSESAFRDAPA